MASLDDQIREVEQALERSPRDLQLATRLAELLHKAGYKRRAAEALVRAADLCSGAGQAVRAVAFLKNAARLDPRNADVPPLLVKSYCSLGMPREVLPHLVQLAEVCVKLGDADRLVDLHARIRLLDPTWNPGVPH